jgi:hypothetical protein
MLIRRRHHISWLTTATVALCFSGCDIDLFGTDSKRITGTYSLSLTDGPDHCAVKAGREFITSNLEVIGWQEPVILCKAYDSNIWDVIESDTGRRLRISEAERQSIPLYSTIDVRPAIDAWKSLKRHKRVW